MIYLLHKLGLFKVVKLGIAAALVFLFLSLDPVNAEASVFVVDNVDDKYLPLATYCTLPTADMCNLRSAWIACSSIHTACEILLPETAYLWMESTYGSMNLAEGMNVTIRGSGSTVAQADVSMQFINYTASPVTTSPPALFLNNMTIFGFGNSSSDIGGALSLVGDLYLWIDGTHFMSNTARAGGAIYISNNTLPASITFSSFYNCSSTAGGGGAVVVGESVKHLTVHGCSFENCSGVQVQMILQICYLPHN